MIQLIDNIYFGILLSVICYEIGYFINKKTGIVLLNPILIGTLLIILFLTSTGIDYSYYNKGADLISKFLGPITVTLALPLYRKRTLLRTHIIPILGGITAGAVTGVVSIILLCRLFNVSHDVFLSLVPKSITNPIGIELSNQIGGIPSITVASIIFTGMAGATVVPPIIKLFRITDPLAKGVAFGTSSHAFGTSKALEMGETEGAVSALSIGIAGLATIIAAPLLLRLMVG